MKKINIIKLTILCSLILGICIITYYLTSLKGYYDIRENLNKNSIEIIVSENLEKNKIDILWIDETKSIKKIVDNGIELKCTYKKYGKNYFLVIYERDTVGKFGYFKLNNWHGHKHIIRLTKNDITKTIDFDVEIFGPDAENKIKPTYNNVYN